MSNGKVYTTLQVARELGVHKNTVFYWLKTGKVKEPKRDSLFNGRIWTESDLIELKNMVGDTILVNHCMGK
jgi:DNA-binding transcriptional MerR regulator